MQRPPDTGDRADEILSPTVVERVATSSHTSTGNVGTTIHTTPSGPRLQKHLKRTAGHVSPPNWLKQLYFSIEPWAWEVGSVCLSLACMSAVVAVLASLNGKALSGWKFGISPNALISVFNAIAEASTLVALSESLGQLKWLYFQQRGHQLADFNVFDEASRGSWGSLKLLISIRWHASIASFGAALTIVHLAMDPFAQQVLDYSTRLAADPHGSASIAVTNAFATNQGVTTSPDDQTYLTEEGAVEAMYRGLFSTNTNPYFVCTTGNCTWTHYRSLGVCSTCWDVTASTKVACGDDEFCTFTTPGGWQLGGTIDGSFYSTFLNSSAGMLSSGLDLINMGVFRYPFNEIRNLVASNNASVSVPSTYECTFRWCEITYSANLTAGIFQETIEHSSELTFDTSCLTGQSEGFTSTTPCTASTANANYTVAAADAFAIGDYMQYGFSGAVGWGNFSINSASASGFPMVRALYAANQGNISETLDSVARSMTAYIRGGPNSTIVSGTPLVSEAFIRVRWIWLSLPIALVVLSAAYLITTISLSSASSMHVWKTSSLASLFHGLKGWSDDELKASTLPSIENSAEDMVAVLKEDENGHEKLLRVGRKGSTDMPLSAVRRPASQGENAARSSVDEDR